MGKGDKKTKKGKIAKGTFGVNRPRKKDKYTETEGKKAQKQGK
ncbi:MAG: 30S ribosomal protein THX [Candidatus Cyclobacteriaceae bacterium M3_2C_046]